MKRTLWLMQAGVCLVVVAMLTGIAWADPTGTADVIQILNGATFRGAGGDEQRVFRTTDPITFEATYYDDFVGCAGAAPLFVQIFVFDQEGKLISQPSASSDAFAPGSKYRLLFSDLPAGVLPIGSHKAAFLVRTCDNVESMVSDFLAIRVVAP